LVFAVQVDFSCANSQFVPVPAAGEWHSFCQQMQFANYFYN
jgi:hypothetical protein